MPRQAGHGPMSGVRVHRHWVILLVGFATLIGTMVPGTAGAYTFVLVGPTDTGIYREFEQDFRQALEALCRDRADVHSCAEGPSVVLTTIDALGQPSRMPANHLLIPLGMAAGEHVAGRIGADATLFTLIPRPAYERLRDCCPSVDEQPVSALFVGQPFAKQLQLLARLLPGRTRVGVLLGPASATQAGALQRIGSAEGLELRMATVTESSEVGRKTGRLLREVDVLFAVPDPTVYNRQTISSILLAAYRHEIPVIGYSQALVQAGATAAVFTGIDQLARSAAAAAFDYWTTGSLPAPGFAAEFTVRLNPEVLRSLGLQTDDVEVLQRVLQDRAR